MNYCSRCGTQVAPTDNFCGSCAAPITRGATPSPEAPAGYQAGANPLAATLQPDQNRPPQQEAPPPAIVHAPQQPAVQPYAAPPVAPPVAAGMPAPPFGAPPPGVDAHGGFGGYTPQPAFSAPAAGGPQPAFGGPPAAAAQPGFGAPPQAAYGPAPVAPAAPAARCDLGHDIPLGSSYCNYGHPIALGEMKIAGVDAFSAPTAYPQEGGLPPTGPMSPFPQAPQQPPAYGAPVQPMYGGGPSQPPPGFQAGPSQPPPAGVPAQPWQAQQAMQQPQPTPPPATPPPAPQEGSARVLRGFLYSFHSDQAGVFWPLYAGRNTAGRAGAGEALEIEIADATTSSRHAAIVCDASSVVIEDEGSTNGTFVNDQPIGYRGKTELRDGDRVRFGAYNAALRLVTR